MKVSLGIALIISLVGISIMVLVNNLKPKAISMSNITELKTNWETKTNNQNILFGHQSVGKNILDGISELGIKSNINDIYIGQNTKPLSKIADFENALNNDVDVAMMKFCYVDLPNKDITANDLFDAYVDMVERVKVKYPNLKLIHLTIPLTTDSYTNVRWLKTQVKQAIHRFPPVIANNIREQYNDLLRAKFGSSVIDLAYFESEEGAYTEYGSRALSSAYTTDGGHLNEIGRGNVAINFIKELGTNL